MSKKWDKGVFNLSKYRGTHAPAAPVIGAPCSAVRDWLTGVGGARGAAEPGVRGQPLHPAAGGLWGARTVHPPDARLPALHQRHHEAALRTGR